MDKIRAGLLMGRKGSGRNFYSDLQSRNSDIYFFTVPRRKRGKEERLSEIAELERKLCCPVFDCADFSHSGKNWRWRMAGAAGFHLLHLVLDVDRLTGGVNRPEGFGGKPNGGTMYGITGAEYAPLARLLGGHVLPVPAGFLDAVLEDDAPYKRALHGQYLDLLLTLYWGGEVADLFKHMTARRFGE